MKLIKPFLCWLMVVVFSISCIQVYAPVASYSVNSMSGTTVGAIATEKIENTALKSDTHALGGEYTVSEAVYSNSELVQYAADWLTGELIFVNNEDYVKNESVYGVYYSNISMDLYLPDKAQNGCEIVWESSFPDIIDIYGKVTRPGYLDSTDWSILTATISMGVF